MQVIRKIYFDKDKEENWINEMCSQGMHLKNRKGLRYIFAEDEKDEYIYRIELLEEGKQKQNNDYMSFLQENNIEIIKKSQSWIYLRRKAADGDFEVYTDLESKIGFYTKVSNYWLGLAAALLMLSVSGLSLFVDMASSEYVVKTIDVVLGGIGLLGFAGAMAYAVVSCSIRKKIRALKTEAEIHQ